MKEIFVNRTFRKKTLARIEQANAILAEYAGQRFTLTLRQLFYQFVARQLVENMQAKYDALGNEFRGLDEMSEHQKLSVSVFEWATRIKEAWQKTVSDFVATGQALKDAKAGLPHGDFTNMVDDGLPFSARVAEYLMAIASNPALANPKHASVLPASWATLAELARLDASTIEKFIEEGRIHPELERKQVALLLPAPKAKAKKAAPKVIEAKAIKIVEPAPLVPEAAPAEPRYLHVEPNETPPIVHVDPPAPADDFMIGHLREELGAAQEEIDNLKSSISELIAMGEDRDREIDELRAARAALEDRDRRTLDYAIHLIEALKAELDNKDGGDPWAIDIEAALSNLREVQGLSSAARQESAPPTQPGDSQTWDQFVDTYRATETPLPENHPKLIAGMVAWADDHGFDVEQLAGAPKEATEIWFATAKNFRGQTAAGNTQRETTAKIFQRFGDERRHSITAMASSLGLKEKFLAGVLDMMFRADFKGMVARDPDGKSWKYTIRRPA